MTTTHDLDAELEAMFAAQDDALEVPTREWSDASQVAPVRFASRRRAYVVGIAAFSAAAVTLGVLAVGSSTDQTVETNRPAAAVTTPATSPPRAPFHVETKQVALDAQALLVDLDDPQKGKRTFTTAAPLEVSGDPGMVNEFTTLELTWQERDVEMRLNIYFQSDGRQWWSNEIRVYDGRKQGSWIYYRGDFFRSPLGTPFVGDFEITAEDHGISGTLRLPSLRLEAFRRPVGCTNPTAPLALEPSMDTVFIPLDAGSGYAAMIQARDATTCLPISGEGLVTTWTTDAPTIVEVRDDGLRGEFTPLALGTTTVRFKAVDRKGNIVGTATIEVRVVPAQSGSGSTAASGQKPGP